MWLILSILLAFWFKAEIPHFAVRTNRQIYQETNALIKLGFSEQTFLAQSQLQPQQSRLANLFFLIFPLIMWFSDNPIIGLMFILLCYLSLLDICYYLTDVRYIFCIFLLVLWQSLADFHNETLFFTLLFCLFIAIFSQLIFKKETFGTGDMLLLTALSPLFDLDQMLLLILASSLLGIGFYCVYWIFRKQKLNRLPFVPFISVAVVMLERVGINY